MESASVCGNRPQSDDRQYSIVMETAAAAHVQSNRRKKSSVKATGLNRVSPTAMILVLCESVSLRRGIVSDFLRHQSGPSCHRRCYLRCPICRHLPGRVVVDKIPACMAPGEISRMATGQQSHGNRSGGGGTCASGTEQREDSNRGDSNRLCARPAFLQGLYHRYLPRVPSHVSLSSGVEGRLTATGRVIQKVKGKR